MLTLQLSARSLSYALTNDHETEAESFSKSYELKGCFCIGPPTEVELLSKANKLRLRLKLYLFWGSLLRLPRSEVAFSFESSKT